MAEKLKKRRDNIYWKSDRYWFLLWIRDRRQTFKGYADRELTVRLRDSLKLQVERSAEGLPATTQGISPLLREHLERLNLVRKLEDDSLALLLEAYVEKILARGCNPEYAAESKGRLLAVFDGCNMTRLRDLDATKIEKWVDGLTVEKGGGDAKVTKRASATTRKHYVIALRAFGSWLEQQELVERSPLARLPAVDTGGQLVVHRRVLTDDEKDRLLKATATRGWSGSPPDADRVMLYLLAMATGLRAGELAVLTPQHFDLKHSCVRLRGEETKNGRPATLPLQSSIVDNVKAFIAGKNPGDRLWPGKWWRKAAELLRGDLVAAGIPYKVRGEQLDFHALRHTFCTDVALSGASLKTQMECTRHATAALLAGYSHPPHSAAVAAVEKLSLPSIPESPSA